MGRLLSRLAPTLLLMIAACTGGYASPNPALSVQASPGPLPPSPSASPAPVATPAPVQAAANATYVGRVWQPDPNRPDHVLLSWAGVRAGLHFFGTGVQMQLDPGTAGQQSWLDISVDGNNTSAILVSSDSNTVSLAANLPRAEHTVWVDKRTEASSGVLTVDHFSVTDGGNFLTPPAAPGATIEVIGASEEVGFGDLGQDCNAYDAVNFEDETLAWGHVAADLLNVAESNLSFSGYGLLASGDGPVAAGYTLQDFFTRTDPFITDSPWSFAAHPVEAVLFDLGSNDYNYYDGAIPEPDFENAYVSFIQTALAAYPKAQIYVVLSPTIADPARTVLATAYQDVVQTLQATAPGQVHYFEFAAADGNGCYDHPLPALHAQMAQAISAQIQSDLR